MSRGKPQLVEEVEIEDEPQPGADNPKVRGLIGLAITSRIKALGDQAKSLGKLGGYETEQAHLEADANVLAVVALPDYSASQGELIPVSPSDVRAAISIQVGKVLEAKRLGGPALSDDTQDDLAVSEACDAIAASIFEFGQAMFGAGYAVARNELANDPVLWWPRAVDQFQPAEGLEG